MEEINFLEVSTQQIRHQINQVIQSYNNDWDIFAELLQNSIDAISREKPIKGHIKLRIDSLNRTIEIEDNGSGIDPKLLPKLLAPFSTDKMGSGNLIGSKGVGVSFVIFSSIKFEIESHHSLGASRAEVKNAKYWLDSDEAHTPNLKFNTRKLSSNLGTKIKLKLPKKDENEFEFFQWTFNQLKMVLLTKTAAGDTATIWGDKVKTDLALTFIDLEGNIHSEEIDCKYMLPTGSLKKASYISLRDFQDWLTTDRNDMEKRKKLRDKLVYHDGEVDGPGSSKIKFWAGFVPKRKTWDEISLTAGLIDEDALDPSSNKRLKEQDDAPFLFSGGMYTATRGMPTGIRTEMKTMGYSGYLPNFFIILDYSQLAFDIGRKSIPGRQLGMLRNHSSEIFNNLVKAISKYLAGDIDIYEDDWEKSSAFAEIRELPELTSKKTKFLKRAFDQEASVAAIFYEMIGNGSIKDFEPYVSGYKERYDLFAKYKKRDVVIEFKHSLSGLFKDFNDERKLFDQVDIVVLWDVTESDRKIAESRGVSLAEEKKSELSSSKDEAFSYTLSYGPVKPIKIISIRRLLEE